MRTSWSRRGRKSSIRDDRVLKRRSAIECSNIGKRNFRCNELKILGSAGEWVKSPSDGWIPRGGQGMSVFAQALLHQNDIMQRCNDSEEKSGSKKLSARDPDSAPGPNLEQKDEKYCSDLREGVGLAKNTGTKIPQPGDGEQNRTGGENRNVPAEDHYGELPRDLAQDRAHQKYRAQQKLVGNRVQVLPQ